MASSGLKDAPPEVVLVTYYRLLRVHGLNDAHSGNVSLCDGVHVWITPTGACADLLAPEDILSFPLVDDPPPGASLDAPLHRAVYRRNPEARAVFHAHGTYALALSLSGGNLRPIDFEGAYYFGDVPILDVPYADYVRLAPTRVAETLRDHPLCLIRGHGLYAWGRTPDQAYKWLSSYESSARLVALARLLGRPPEQETP
jgi:L-fuculose-phosphate aldolase